MDRFSNLPDEVLCLILSFLTTQEAALTSVLAKRWRNLLAFVPCLTINDTEFLHPEEGKQDRQEIKQSFIDFVDRVLTLQGSNSPLKKFSLECCVTVGDRDRVDGWINNALARCVSDLDLKIIIAGEVYYMSPKCFECSTLVSLKIHRGISVSSAAATGRSILLPLLKTLVLDSVHVCPKDFEILLRSMPSLEELVLVCVRWDEMDVTVSSASVKTLTIELGEYCLSALSFDTPSLVHFKYSGFVAGDYPVVNLGNLLDAQIVFFLSVFRFKILREPDDDSWLIDKVFLGYSNVWKFFHGSRNVQNLDLSPDALEVLFLCRESMPWFNNLKSLTIRSEEDRGWQAMPALLRNCPYLETLVLEGLVHHVTNKCGDVCVCISREDEGHSLTLCPVTVMEIHGFQGADKELAMIEHFLNNLPSLKKMEVYAVENDPTQLRNREIVLKTFELYGKISSCNVKLFI